jgi:hypothetical protein
MKTMMRASLCLTVAATILAAALAAPAAAQTLVPFKGALQGTDADEVFNFPVQPVTTTGTGTGAHLGRFSFTERSEINVVTGSATGSARWTAANGDTLDTAFTALGGPTDAPPACPGLGDVFFSVTEIHTITGGTGQFAGAQGSFKAERQASPMTFRTCGSFGGLITSPGAGR